jgi:uroporphyrin-III C-methyltransferase / precorrin-2 dehydrogenase / sirohydrochlorin ferrochelatase
MSGECTELESAPERLQALARLPLFFALKGKRAVIAGGSRAAAWKAELVSATGARVDLYAVEACGEISKLAAELPAGAVKLHRRDWTAADLQDAALAVGDFRDDDEAAAFAAAARAAGVPVNVIDKPAHCDFSFGAIVNRSPLVIGISTDGAAPVFARAIRGKLEALLPKGFARWAAVAARWRAAVKASGLSFAGRRRFWELFTVHAVTNADDKPGQDDFERLIAEAGGARSGVEYGRLTVVEVDHDPNFLTLGAVRALHAADVVLFDERVTHAILDFARREARKICLGKINGDDEIEALMAELGSHDARVVRLKYRGRFNAAESARAAAGRTAPTLVPHENFMTAD